MIFARISIWNALLDWQATPQDVHGWVLQGITHSKIILMQPLDKTEIFRIGQVLYPSLVGACVVTLYALMHISDDYLSTSLCSFFIKALNSLVSFLPLFFLVTFFSSSWLGKETQPWVIFQMELVSLLKCYQCSFSGPLSWK